MFRVYQERSAAMFHRRIPCLALAALALAGLAVCSPPAWGWGGYGGYGGSWGGYGGWGGWGGWAGPTWNYPSGFYGWHTYPATVYPGWGFPNAGYVSGPVNTGFPSPLGGRVSYSYPGVPDELPARITVHVPADAELWFDGQLTAQRGRERVFTTPPVEHQRRYAYEVRARWMEDGREVDQTRRVRFHGGDQVTVDFTDKARGGDTRTAAPAGAGPAGETLYDRLGGAPEIRELVDDFVTRALVDKRINFTRKGTPHEWQATPENVAQLKKHMTAYFEKLTGGPQKYQGESLKEAHRHMDISEQEFNALAEDLKASMDKKKVPAKDQQDLLRLVNSTRGKIVGD
jgi:hemoglobin